MTLGAVPAAKIIVAGLLLILAFCVLGVAIWYYRRWWMGQEETSGIAWTFDDLRRLRDDGDLTDEEYERMRAALIRRYAGGDVSGGGAPSGSEGREEGESEGFDLKK
jgi:hypothetical protein